MYRTSDSNTLYPKYAFSLLTNEASKRLGRQLTTEEKDAIKAFHPTFEDYCKTITNLDAIRKQKTQVEWRIFVLEQMIQDNIDVPTIIIEGINYYYQHIQQPAHELK